MKKVIKSKVAISCILTNAAVALLVLILKKHLPPVVPLFYGLPVSDSQLTRSTYLIIPPLAATFITFINFALSKLTKDSFLEKILNALSISTTILSAISIIEVILLVGVFA